MTLSQSRLKDEWCKKNTTIFTLFTLFNLYLNLRSVGRLVFFSLIRIKPLKWQLESSAKFERRASKCINFAFLQTHRKWNTQRDREGEREYTKSGNKNILNALHVFAYDYNISITIADCRSLEWLAICLSAHTHTIRKDSFKVIICVYFDFFFSLLFFAL